VAPLVVAVALAAVGVVTSFGGGGESDQPDEAIPTSLEAAIQVVEQFAEAWNRGDADAVGDLIIDDWDSIQLPGFSDPFFAPADGRPALTNGIAFLTAVAGFLSGPCDAELAPPDSRATAVVRCHDADFGGDYLDAVRRNVWDEAPPGLGFGRWVPVPGVTFGIQGDRIVAIESVSHRFTPQAYCIWGDQARPELAASLFDLHCRPATTPSAGGAHAEAAEAFGAAGSPLPSWRLAEARLTASYVDRFVEHHNLADTHTAQGWLSPAVSPADLPGFAGAADEPAVADYLQWSARLMEIQSGECAVEYGGDFTVVTCPHMTVTGPLLDEPLSQPTRFTLGSTNGGERVARAFARIVAVEPLNGLLVPVEQVCRDLRQSHPAAASGAFTEDCSPVYTREAADTLAVALGQ
jgi:hypothetical protein